MSAHDKSSLDKINGRGWNQRIALLWLIYFLVPSGLNPVAFFLISPVADALWFGQVDPLYSMIETGENLLVHGIDPVTLTRIIPFAVTLPLIVIFVLRMMYVIKNTSEERRNFYLFDSPFFVSIFITLGWFVAFLVNIYAFAYLGLTYSASDFFISLGFTLFIAFFLNILGFYIMDYLNRSYLVPALAGPEPDIHREARIFSLSLKSRIFILLAGTAGFSIYFYTYTLYIHSIKLTEAGIAAPVTGYLILGAILFLASVIIGLLFHGGLVFPLRSMEVAAGKIEQGEYQHRIPIRTADELGLLSRAMNSMSRGLAEKDQISRLFGRYVSPDVAELLMRQQDAAETGSIRNVTVMFTDIAGYTRLSEGRAPENIVAILNEYFSTIVDVIARHGGSVNKYIGDAVMAVFGAPLDDPLHPSRAVDAAWEISKIASTRDFAGVRLETRIGVNSGDVLAGSIGSADRREYTVIGDAVNLAQRMEAAGKELGRYVILGPETARRYAGERTLISIGGHSLKGVSQKVELFSIDS